MLKPTVIDTNIVVSGLITSNPESPVAVTLDALLEGRFPCLMSNELLIEYAEALQRPKIADLHRLTREEIDNLLARVVANAMWREPVPADEAPDANDNHLWRLLASEYGSVLVTGDKLLLRNPPAGHSVIAPRSFVEILHGRTIHEPAGINSARTTGLE